MKYKLQLLDFALEDVYSACEYYQNKQPGLESRFMTEVEDAFERIVAEPQMYVRKYKKLQMAPVHHFPYWVYYRIEGDLIRVAAIYHEKRSPETLIKRIKK